MNEDEPDYVWYYCSGCDKEYCLPEDLDGTMEECPFCGEKGIHGI